jgi:hypothetical protein
MLVEGCECAALVDYEWSVYDADALGGCQGDRTYAQYLLLGVLLLGAAAAHPMLELHPDTDAG